MTMKTTVHFPDVQSFIEFLLRPDRAFRQRYMFRSVGDLDLEGVTLLSGGVPSKEKIVRLLENIHFLRSSTDVVKKVGTRLRELSVAACTGNQAT